MWMVIQIDVSVRAQALETSISPFADVTPFLPSHISLSYATHDFPAIMISKKLNSKLEDCLLVQIRAESTGLRVCYLGLGNGDVPV